jgi:hypothetical protein
LHLFTRKTKSPFHCTAQSVQKGFFVGHHNLKVERFASAGRREMR